jgi:hypothetical protein
MIRRFSTLRSLAPLAMLLCALALLAAGELRTTSDVGTATDPSKADAIAKADGTGAKASSLAVRSYTTEYVRGQVVWLDEALERLYGVTTDPAVAQTSVALETPQGQLLPVIPDVRGRAFAVDSNLRDIELKLLVRRYGGVPMIQVIRVLRPKADGLYEIDYWCDVCAIPMFILKACECCQGPTRLRERLVEDAPEEAGR